MHDYEQLQRENYYLKNLLARIMHNQNMQDSSKILTKRSPLTDRIKLIKELFKGREDTYAIHWESKDGKGYAPARTKEKPPARKLLPITEEVLIAHIRGEKMIGIYPLLLDNTCKFLVIDLDKRKWQEDVMAIVETCKNYNIPYHIERSKSGNGTHIWIFFTSFIPAKEARTLGMFLLKKTNERSSSFQLNFFDRLFPNQDNLPEGGLGNLFALPLQKNPGRKGNSLFIDENFTPFLDQWMCLSTARKMTREEVLSILHPINEKYNDIKDITDMIPGKIDVILKNGIYIDKGVIPPKLKGKIIELVSFSNPQYYKAKNNRFPTKNIPRVISCIDENQQYLILPRGCLKELLHILEDFSIEVNLIDEQYNGEIIETNFHGNLSPQQEEAVSTLTNHQQGVLSATTGFGKTVIATSIISRRKVNTLIIVHRTLLIQQWVEKLAAFLSISTTEIGQIGGGKNKITGFIDVATIQGLNFGGRLKSFITQYVQVIVDECHIISAVTFESVLKQIRPKFTLGLTATPKRKDGMHPIITMQCGPIRYEVSAKSQAQVRPFIHRLIPRETTYDTNHTDFQDICEELILNTERNRQIFDDVLQSLENGRSPIILTNRVQHVEILTNMFTGFAKNIVVLSGIKKKKDQREELERLSKITNQEERLIIATGKYIGEGFDDARLDTLFLTMPISWKGTLHQYVGRLHRNYDSKQEVQVYDYVDAKVPLLKKMYRKRFSGYKSMGYLHEGEKSSSVQTRLF